MKVVYSEEYATLLSASRVILHTSASVYSVILVVIMFYYLSATKQSASSTTLGVRGKMS